ncbi:MAG: PQQ-binding-like beta-propeller repeat protein [Myxococcaceae bacterium]
MTRPVATTLALVILAAGCQKTTTTSPYQAPLCVAKTCASEHLSCGLMDDGCGAMRLCGECPTGNSCDAGACVGPPFDAGCMPTACPTSMAMECQRLDDGCGHQIDCGCTGGERCVEGLCDCSGRDGGCGALTLTVLGAPGGAVELTAVGPAPGPFHLVRSDGVGAPHVVSIADRALMVDPSPPAVERLAYRLQSDAGVTSNVTVVTRTTGWPTIAGDNQHSGANAFETGVPPLALQWSFAFNYGGVGQVAVADGIVYVTGENETYDGARLVALDAATGAMRFEREFPIVMFGSAFSWPSIYGGDLYTGECATVFDYLALDPRDGGVRWTSPTSGSCFGGGTAYGGWPAMLEGGRLYEAGEALDPADGGTLFAMPGLFSSFGAYGGNIYGYYQGNLQQFDGQTGAMLSRYNRPFINGTPDTYPVFGDDQVFLVLTPQVVAVDLSTMTESWSTNTAVSYVGGAGYYRGVVYAIGLPGTLVAFDPANGNVLWTFAGDGALRSAPVFAGHYLYVASDRQTFAVDLDTHQSVWSSDPQVTQGGQLAIAGGMLYVTGLGVVYAFALTPQ